MMIFSLLILKVFCKLKWCLHSTPSNYSVALYSKWKAMNIYNINFKKCILPLSILQYPKSAPKLTIFPLCWLNLLSNPCYLQAFSVSTAWAHGLRSSSSQEQDRSDQFSLGTFPRHTKLGFSLDRVHKSAYTIQGVTFMQYGKAHLIVLAHSKVASAYFCSLVFQYFPHPLPSTPFPGHT